MKSKSHAFRCGLLLLATLTSALTPLHGQRPLPPPAVGGQRDGHAHPPVHLFGVVSRAPAGFSPAQIRHAYGFDQVANQGAGQTIGIVDAYDQPNIAADLGVFSQRMGLAACSTSTGCFRKVYAAGYAAAADPSWALEISLDVEWAHAIAPQATILLVEGASNSFPDLMRAVQMAVQQGASVVSMSWGAPEFPGEISMDPQFAVSGVTFLASAGDQGAGVLYPAASPDVVAIGGTHLTVGFRGIYVSETAWSGSGGGISAYEYEPRFQSLYGTPHDAAGKRGVPDVGYDADPATGYAVYNSAGASGSRGWYQAGGTSAGVPQWAALIAIANSTRATARKHNLSSVSSILYSLAKSVPTQAFHSVTQGENGGCGILCNAGPGYDYITGLGTPQANYLLPALAAQP